MKTKKGFYDEKFSKLTVCLFRFSRSSQTITKSTWIQIGDIAHDQLGKFTLLTTYEAILTIFPISVRSARIWSTMKRSLFQSKKSMKIICKFYVECRLFYVFHSSNLLLKQTLKLFLPLGAFAER